MAQNDDIDWEEAAANGLGPTQLPKAMAALHRSSTQRAFDQLLDAGGGAPRPTNEWAPEERATFAPLVKPEGGTQFQLGAPGLAYQPAKAAATLLNPGTQYRVGDQDPRIREGYGVAGASPAATGSLLSVRPAGSLGTFLGRRQARHLLEQGRPTAWDALNLADIMEAGGASHPAIRDAAHELFRQNEPTFGTVWKPHPEEDWRFEISDKPAKLDKFDKRTPLAPLGEQFTHPDLYAAEPGIEGVDLRRYGPGASSAQGYHWPGVPEAGVPSEIGVNTAARLPEQRRNLVAELQHEIQLRNQSPRGGAPAEFEPGGALAHYLLPGETPQQAYARLLGERESKVAKARANLAPSTLQRTPVEKTIVDLQRAGLLPPRGGLIREGYNGGRFLSLEDPEEVARARQPTPGQREQLGREDQLGRNAAEMAKHAATVVDTLKAAGVSPKEIAKTLEDTFGTPVDPAHVSGNNGWWNPTGRVSLGALWPRQANLMLAQFHQQGAPTPEMARRLSQAFGSSYSPRMIGDQIDRLRLNPARASQSTTEPSWQPDALALLMRHQNTQGMTAQQLANLIYNQTGQVTSKNSVIGKINRLREDRMRQELAEDLAKARGTTLRAGGLPFMPSLPPPDWQQRQPQGAY